MGITKELIIQIWKLDRFTLQRTYVDPDKKEISTGVLFLGIIFTVTWV